jgi:Zn-dependent M28 family amino/carboxypeptidase
VGALVRSPTPVSLSTPHTGALHYDEASPRVPAVSLSVEDSAWLRRLAERGETPRVRLTLGAEDRGEVPSHNVIGEVRGREHPEQVVILSGHLDSWDVGQGAQDDGAGCAAAMEAGRLLAALPVPPRRSVRVILYVNEENGLSGGRACAEAHAAEARDIVAAIEADTGAGQPLGFSFDLRNPATGEGDPEAGARAVAALQPWVHLLRSSGATVLTVGGSGSDISPLVGLGVPGIGLSQDTSGYWPVHHTAADTLDKVDPALLARNTAALAVMGWLLAEAEASLPRATPPAP